MTIRVVIADDHDLFRDGLGLLITSNTDYVIVGEATTGDEAVEIVAVQQPDLLLLDVEMGDYPVVTTIRQVRRVAPGTRIAILTMHSDRVLQRQTLEAGASAFLTKSEPKAELMQALQSALLSKTSNESVPIKLSGLLSPREQEVVQLMSRAMSNKEIATWLSIAEGTVKRHTGNIYEKLDARSRMDAVAKARLAGIVGF